MTAGRLKIWNDLAGEWEYPPGGDSQPTNYSLGKTILEFQETAGAGLYTATFDIPEGAMIGDVRCYALSGAWDADTAVLEVGDDNESAGFINGSDLVSALVGPYDPTAALSEPPYSYDSWAANNTGVSAGYDRNWAFGTDNRDAGIPYSNAGTFTATVTTTGAGGTTGALRIEVMGYGLPAETISAVKS